MITDQHERIIVSSLGWVDHSALWSIDIQSGHQASTKIGEANYLTLRHGRGGCFAAVHHFDSDRLEISAHRFADPGTIVSRLVVSGRSRKIEGDAGIWTNLPHHYVAYLVQPGWSDYALLSIDGDALTLQSFDWFDDEYDKDYQGIVGVTEVPGSQLLLVSVQRDSEPVLFDPIAGREVSRIALAGRRGNPEFLFRQTAPELWAHDYDTILKIDPSTWQIIAQSKLQEADVDEAQFIGGFSFDATEKICAIARPFSSDVVGISPSTLEIHLRADLGGQPINVAVLEDLRVFARDWHSGTLLQGKLTPTQ